ncbi:membrane protein insertase YidC [Chloroflexia bacterium SDU3-3]|nr:membrane protein insertase YidC [Chloroflexia bacterium SDU3-3]
MNPWGTFVGILEQIILTFQAWTGNAGIALIIFTILARLIILPLTITSLLSSRKMQALQPQMKELQRKYGKDPQRLNEETLKLYRENKVNPAGGCLPMFLQLPIFFAVYQAVINLAQTPASEAGARAMLTSLSAAGANITTMTASLDANHLNTSFLWLHDLGRPDPLFILPVLSVLLQLIVQLMSTPRIQDPQQKAMMQSMLIMPIVFGYIGFTFPSGAVLYWVVGSIISIIQTYVISGWGSLANYLKFLPTTGGLLPPVAVTTHIDEPANVAAIQAIDPDDLPKRSFWDVLAPLAEQPIAATAAATPEAPLSDEGTDTTNADIRRRVGQQPNPRRRNARR